MDRPELRTGALFGGTFRISHQLGAGGMAVVYAVEQVATGQPRALKLMHPQMLADQSLRARFEQEARVSALIPSEHVVQVIDAGVDEETDIPWIAMELLDGEDVDAFVRRRGALDAPEALEIMRQTCHALGAAHRVGVVHRDLKPQNLFVSVPPSLGAAPVVKVLDFGIAKVVADARRSTSTLGTPLWMSPEHSDPRATVAPAADVWSLGLLAFWLLTGEEFWLCARDPDVAMQAILRELLLDPIPAATDRARELGVEERLPPGFDAWFARCLMREAGDRYADATDAYDELRRELASVEPSPALDAPQFSEVHERVRKTFENSAPIAVVRSAGRTAPPPATIRTGGLQRIALVALSTALVVSGVLAYALGVVRFGPPPPSESDVAQASVEGEPGDPALQDEAPSLPRSEASAAEEPSSAPPQPSALPSVAIAPSSPRRAAAAPRARPFDANAAHVAIARATRYAKLRCGKHEGPRSISVTVYFNRAGSVQRVLSRSPRQSTKMSAMCMKSMVHFAHVEPFDGPEQSVPASVSIE